MISKLKHISLSAIFTLASLILFAGCSKDDQGDKASSARLVAETVNCNATSNKIVTEGSSRLTCAVVIADQGQTPWCSFNINNQVSQTTAKVGEQIFLYLKQNTSDADRTATIEVSYSDGYAAMLTLTQTAFSSSADFDRAWAEQPVYAPSNRYVYKTYFTTLAKGNYVRSYSICYNLDKKVSNWVAYPLHKSYTSPNVGRTDKWAYDPNNQLPVIPDNAQQYILATYGTGYSRGHQCPSADRYSTIATNEQTFYATNMMPQNGSFNGGIWMRLEGYIRANMVAMGSNSRADTLYVVTGAFFGDNKTMTDRRGNRIGVPTNCWKVLLRTKAGNTGKLIQNCTADELIGIGFWFANGTSNPDVLSNCALSIAEIERRTGFTFFRNLNPDAADVKKQNQFSDWAKFGE